MKTVKIEMDKISKHTVSIELPAYFKKEHAPKIIEYCRIYENKSDKVVIDKIVNINGVYDVLNDHQFYAKVLDYDLSSEQEFINAIIEARDYLDSKIDHLSGYTKETEEDRELSEQEIEEMIQDSKTDDRIKFEQENFHELTRE